MEITSKTWIIGGLALGAVVLYVATRPAPSLAQPSSTNALTTEGKTLASKAELAPQAVTSAEIARMEAIGAQLPQGSILSLRLLGLAKSLRAARAVLPGGPQADAPEAPQAPVLQRFQAMMTQIQADPPRVDLRTLAILAAELSDAGFTSEGTTLRNAGLRLRAARAAQDQARFASVCIPGRRNDPNAADAAVAAVLADPNVRPEAIGALIDQLNACGGFRRQVAALQQRLAPRRLVALRPPIGPRPHR
jgi:hypothetical protein